jgi:UDP-GlcNAc:undecaprenyl-phosphate GlcNAc-1-phosphate transferase
MPEVLLALGAGALAAAVAMPAVIVLLRRLRVLDVPNARSSHSRPTLRGGGLGVAVGVVTGVAVGLAVAGEAVDADVAALVLVPLGLGALGFADDVRSLGVRSRMLCQLVLGGAGAGLLVSGTDAGPSAVGAAVLVGAVWVTGELNATNFMDGINGITGITAAVIAGSQAVVGVAVDSPAVAIAGAALAGAAVGFLPYNVPRARVFLGDSGSYLIGSMLGLNAVAALRDGAPVVAVAAPFAVVLADTSVTLLRRVRAGERWWTPHRSHVYQRLASGSLGHTRAAVLVGALTAICAGAGLAALPGDEVVASTLAVTVVAVVVGGYLRLPGQIVPSVPTVMPTATPSNPPHRQVEESRPR